VSDDQAHAFELWWTNIMSTWGAQCACGEGFGLSPHVEDLGRSFDLHLEDVFGAEAPSSHSL
jgi:hypothetical protein